jgi:hypothetical protein
MAELKHVGRVKSTNKKCVVAYRTLPGDAYNCLIVPTENLPDSYHDAIINLVESTTGQDAHEFADGSIMLSALHTQGKLVKISTDQVEMQPTTSVSILLSELNQVIAEQRGVAIDDLSVKSNMPDAKQAETPNTKKTESDVTRTTSTSVNETEAVNANLTPEEQAKEYRSKADRLAKDAANFRRLAEDLVPTKKQK